MRIGIDATALPRQPVGAGNYIIHLVRSLASMETGYELVVFAQQSGCQAIGIPDKPGVTWVKIPDKNPALRLLWEQTAFPRLVRRAKVDLLHSLHYTRPLNLPCASVVTFHDMTFFLYPYLHTRSKRLFFPAAIRISAKLADTLIAVSESTRKDAIQLLNIPPEKIFTVQLGIGEEFHPITDEALLGEVCRKYNLPEEFILNVGLVEPRKNLSLLLKAYKKLTEEEKTPPLAIVGRFGWMYDEVLRLVDDLGLKEKVQFTGYIPAQDLPIVYNLAKVFVYPSLYEGFGLPPLEAMACGTPVITSAISSIPEIIGDAGVMVPVEDEAALSQALHDLLNDPQLRKDLTTRGLERAKQFTWKRTAQETLKVYQHVLMSM